MKQWGDFLEIMSRSRSRSFFFLVICFFTGIAIHSIFLNLPLFVPVILFFLLIPAVIYFWRREERLIIIGLLIVVLGILRFASSLEPWGNPLTPWRDKEVSIQGTVTKRVNGITKAALTLRGEKLFFRGESHIIKESIIIFAPQWNDYEPGERVQLLCVLRQNKEWPKEKIRWLCSGAPSQRDGIRTLGTGEMGLLENIILKTRASFLQGLRSAFPEPQGSLARGLILGNDFGFSRGLMDSFIATGTAHIVAVSGWNVTMIVNGMLFVLIFLGIARARALAIMLLFIIFYVMLTGGGSSVLRAGIMGALSGLSWQIERPYRTKNAIAAAALLMVLFDPRILAFDLGFILSFSATLGLVFLVPVLRRFAPKKINIHILKWSAETLVQTGAATIFTVPIILIVFGNLSLVSPLANLLILPAVPLATVLVFVSALLSMAHAGAGAILGALSSLPLTYIIGIAELLSKIPLGSISFGPFWAKILVLSIPATILLIKFLLKVRKKEVKSNWEIYEV